MVTLQYKQEILFITKEGKELDCVIYDNFAEVVRYYKKGTGHESNAEMMVYGLQHGTMICASGDNRPYASKQVIVREGETVIYREDRYTPIYKGDYSDALRFEPEQAFTHCNEEDYATSDLI